MFGYDMHVHTTVNGEEVNVERVFRVTTHECEKHAVLVHRRMLEIHGRGTTTAIIEDTSGQDDTVEFIASKDGTVTYLD